jgi:hypothetical protein
MLYVPAERIGCENQRGPDPQRRVKMKDERDLYSEFIADVAECLKKNVENGLDCGAYYAFLFRVDRALGLIERRYETKDAYVRSLDYPAGTALLCSKRKDETWGISFGMGRGFIAPSDGHGSFDPKALFATMEMDAVLRGFDEANAGQTRKGE